MKKAWLITVMICLSVLSFLNINASTVPFLSQKGEVAQYVINLNDDQVMLSRDGSRARALEGQTYLTKPGTYYITRTNKRQETRTEVVKIPYPKRSGTLKCGRGESLEEVIKQLLEESVTKAELQLTDGSYTFTELFDEVGRAITTVANDYPLLTYSKYTVTSAGGNRPTLTLTIDYPLADATKYHAMKTKAFNMIPTILGQLLNDTMKDYEREYAIFRYIAESTTYATHLEDAMNHTMAGALTTRTAVCDGYARTFMYLCNSVGIPTWLISGTAGGEAHAWNMVEIQKQIYHVDVTWADQDQKKIGNFYDYFNENDTYMAKTHTWNRNLMPKAVRSLYNLLYAPIPLEKVYRVYSASEWQALQKKLSGDGLSEATIIFYHVPKNKWQKAVLTKEIMQAEKKSIAYFVDEKYDALIIAYKTQ